MYDIYKKYFIRKFSSISIHASIAIVDVTLNVIGNIALQTPYAAET